MISKILLTLAVIVVAILILKQRKDVTATSGTNRTSALPKSGSAASTAAVNSRRGLSDYRIAAYVFLAVMISLASVVYFFNWQDDHRIVTVTLYGSGNNEAEPVVYQVYQYQLQTRSFTTTDGIVVNVAGNERMVVEGLD